MTRTSEPDSGTPPSPGRGVGFPADDRERFELLVRNAREVVFCHDADLTILYASPSARRVLDFEAAELIGHRLDDFTHPDDLAELLSAFALAGEAGDQASALFRFRSPDSGWRWCEIVCRGVTPEDPGVGDVHATIRDVTKYKRIEKAIERVAREWRTTFDAANDAVVMLDADGRVMRVNRSTLDLFECEFQDLIGRCMLEVATEYLGLDDPFGVAEAWRERVRVRNDLKLDRGDTWLRSTLDIVETEDAGIDGAVLFISDISAEKAAEFQLRASLQEVRNLSAHLQTIREEERRSIAREVHDELGHALTALKMDIAWLVKRIPEHDESARQSGRELTGLVDQTIQVVRRIVSELRPPVLDDLGLVAALEWLCGDFKRYHELHVDLETGDLPSRLRGQHASAVFRMVQEALTNVARHAGAGRASVALVTADGGYRLSIEDDGSGFDPERQRDVAGFGLLGIAERARELGGKLEITSSPGAGTRLQIDLPQSALS